MCSCRSRCQHSHRSRCKRRCWWHRCHEGALHTWTRNLLVWGTLCRPWGNLPNSPLHKSEPKALLWASQTTSSQQEQLQNFVSTMPWLFISVMTCTQASRRRPSSKLSKFQRAILSLLQTAAEYDLQLMQHQASTSSASGSISRVLATVPGQSQVHTHPWLMIHFGSYLPTRSCAEHQAAPP